MKPPDSTFISSAEAAFIADVSDRQINRVIDEQLVPAGLMQVENGRRVSRLAAAFASFYFKTEALLTAQLRRDVVATIADRMRIQETLQSLSAFDADEKDLLTVTRSEMPGFKLDLASFFREATARARLVDEALDRVSVDPEVLGGAPVFKGTRVPIETILGSLDAGEEFGRLRQSYPFLTEELAEAARVYATVRPRRGRPPRLSEVAPTVEVKSSKVVRPAGR